MTASKTTPIIKFETFLVLFQRSCFFKDSPYLHHICRPGSGRPFMSSHAATSTHAHWPLPSPSSAPLCHPWRAPPPHKATCCSPISFLRCTWPHKHTYHIISACGSLWSPTTSLQPLSWAASSRLFSAAGHAPHGCFCTTLLAHVEKF